MGNTKLRMATLYTSNLETVKEATVNLDTWVKVKKKQLKIYTETQTKH